MYGHNYSREEITGTFMLPVVGMSNTTKQLMIILPVTREIQ